MTTIDERVVAMKFDNAQFERGVQTSLNSLNNLNKGLQLQGATKGLQDVTKAAQNVKLDHIQAGVQAIGDRFKAMSVIAITALSTITHQAIFAGQQLVRSLTIDPIKQGLQEYETNLNSIQTIMANTGLEGKAGLQKVTDALEELNLYSDQTIYNFSEMARNIGTFTAAGVDLDSSTAAIKGIANLAAISGSNSQQAAGAMYQLSQALAAGRLTLIDWNSVVNAGMGGKVFQDSLIETARVHGVAIDSIIKDAGSFRNSLEKGWITSEILTETLAKFTGDLNAQQLKTIGYTDEQIAAILKMGKTAQDAATKVKTVSQLINTLQEATTSGWAKTWQLLFGDFHEARELFTEVNNVVGGFIQKSSEARNKVIEDWKTLGGRTVLIDAIKNAWNALLNILKPIRDAWREIFPAKTGQDLYNMTVALRDFTAKLKMGGENMDRLKRIAKGFFSILSLGWDIVKGVVGVLFRLLGLASEGSGGFLEFVARIADWVVEMRNAIKEGKGLERFFKTLGDILSLPLKGIKAIGEFIGGLFDGVDTKGAGDGLLNFLGDMLSSFEKFGGKVGEFFGNIGELIKKGLSNITWDDVLNTIFAGLGLAGTGVLGLIINKMVGGFGGGDGILGKLGDTFEQLTDALSSLQNTLRAATLLQIAAAVGVLTISVVALSKIDAAGLTRALSAITVMFAQLGAAMFLMEKYLQIDDIAKMYGIAGAMIVLGIAVNVLASAVKKLADLNWDELARGLFGVTILLAALVVAVQNMPNDKKMFASSVALVVLAGAIKLLASAVTDLSGLSWEEMAKGLTGVGGVLLALGLFTKFADANKMGVGSGVGLLLLAGSIWLMGQTLSDIGNMTWDKIGTGLASMTAALALMVAATKLVPPSAIGGAAGVLIVALSLGSIGDALNNIGDLSWGEIGRALTAMLGALTIITAALYVIPPTAPLAAAGVLLVAMSLERIAKFLDNMSQFSWEEIGKSMTIFAGTMAIIAGSMLLMTGAVPGAIALMIVSAALRVLTPVLQALGELSWEEIGKGLATLAGVFLILGVAGLTLGPVVPILIGLGAAIFLIGAAVLAAGVGVLAFATGLTLLSELGEVAVGNIKNILLELVGMIPTILMKIGEGIVAFAGVIANSGPAITAAITTVLLALITAIDILIPKIVDTLYKMLTKMLETLNKYVPKLVDAGMRLLTAILNGIADNIGKVVKAASRVIREFLDQLGDELPKIQEAGADLIIKFVKGLSKTIDSKSEEMGEAGADLAIAIVEGMIRGLGSGRGRIADKAREVAKSALDAAKNFLGIASPSKEFHKIGEWSVEGFVNGMDDNVGKAEKSAIGLGGKTMTALRRSLASISETIKDEIDLDPTITPVLDLSRFKRDVEHMGSFFVPEGAKPRISFERGYSQAQQILADQQSRPETQGHHATGTHTEFTFIQNNNSPKALSPADIYRQTNNQLSRVKEVLP